MRFILRNFFLACGLSTVGRQVSAHVQLGQDLDGESAADHMGWGVSLSLDGTIVAIGAPENDGVNGADSGHVQVLKWGDATDQWEKLGDDIDGESAGGFSGMSVSLSADGTIVAIGAPKNSGINGSLTGHVRVYQWNGTDNQWERLGQDIDGEAAVDWSGQTVSISADGTRLAIGAYRNNNGGGADSGHVRVYQWSDTSDQWEQLGQDIDGTAAESYVAAIHQGHAVSLSADGGRVAIGAHYVNNRKGYVRVYQWDAGTDAWEQLGDDIDGEGEQDQSGWAVSLSEDGARVAIGAYVNSAKGSATGHVRVYQWDDADTAQWGQLGQDLDGERFGDQSGYAVSISADGGRVAIGARHNVGNGEDAGHVRIYDWSDTNDQWEQFGLDIDAEFRFDESGSAVSISADGTRVAIGAPENILGRGHVRVYEIALPPPTESPTAGPTRMPSSHPSKMPSSHPSGMPTPQPSMSPMPTPSAPTTSAPTTSAPTTPMPTPSAPTTPMPTQPGADSGATTLTTAALLPLAVGWGAALFSFRWPQQRIHVQLYNLIYM